MDNYQKYLKYKNKYLEFKKQKGGSNRPKERISAITEFNNGRFENMSLQCFWISISSYLRKNGINVSVRELRKIGGLDRRTENIDFDGDNESYLLAAESVASQFGLTITIFLLNKQKQITSISRVIGNGPNNVYIAQLPEHFELITNYTPEMYTGETLYFNEDITNNSAKESSSSINPNNFDIEQDIIKIKQEIEEKRKEVEQYGELIRETHIKIGRKLNVDDELFILATVCVNEFHELKKRLALYEASRN